MAITQYLGALGSKWRIKDQPDWDQLFIAQYLNPFLFM